MNAIASQITGVWIICSTVCSGADQRKHQGSASLDFLRGIHRWPMDSHHKGPVTRKMFPIDDVIMNCSNKSGNNTFSGCFYLTIILIPLNFHVCHFTNNDFSVHSCAYSFKDHFRNSLIIEIAFLKSLPWRHNGHPDVSNHRRLDSLFNYLFRLKSKETWITALLALCEGKPPVTGGFPSQRASNVEIVCTWWHNHDQC